MILTGSPVGKVGFAWNSLPIIENNKNLNFCCFRPRESGDLCDISAILKTPRPRGVLISASELFFIGDFRAILYGNEQ